MVSEAGASVYSASEVARDEFPNLDVTVKGAISIARRLQDPLAELIKVDPKSIGVGQYQHDVNQSRLKRKLDDVVDSCVNTVGVNLNTASYHLLSHVAGIGPSLAKTVVEYRASKGLIESREALKEIPRFSEKIYEQAAGFIRVPESKNPLDNTGVHPEQYAALEALCQEKGVSLSDPQAAVISLKKYKDELKEKFGEFTATDVLQELEKPGRDPRDEFVAFQFRDDIHAVSDLVKDMVCPGVVTNVTNFGAFVDIGVHQDGLVHLSQLADRFVKDPREVVNPGDHVTVKVLDVDKNKSQISLTMRNLRPERQVDNRPDPRRVHVDNRESPRRHDNRPQQGAPQGHRQNQERNRDPNPRLNARPNREQKPRFSNNPFEILSALKKDIKNS